MVAVYTARAYATAMIEGLTRPGTDRVEVYDLAGRRIASMGRTVAGRLSATDLSAGEYVVRFHRGARVDHARLTLA